MEARKLPAGTVTLLFTDIEGSTRMLQEVGREAWVRALTEHRRLLRRAFTMHSGVELEMLGESSYFAFPFARDAVAAAVAGQRALQEHEWESMPIRVRIGLHTGEPTQAEGQYAGIDVHRAARVMSAGHGGQVLVSQRTAEIVRDELAGEIELIDLGEHRLKDLSAGQRLYQAVAGGLPAKFPPLKTLHVTNLPVQAHRMIGRQDELAEITRRIRELGARLLTLTGPGGTGKTRLSLQAAAEVIEHFPGGVYFVPLAPIQEPALVLPTIASSLGVREQPGQDLSQLLIEHLAQQRTLLVLDNFEQIVDAAPDIASLLTGAPAVSFLVTSREPLRISGEQVFAVPALPLPRDGAHGVAAALENDAVALFVERAHSAVNAFVLTDDNAGAVAAICTLLDGLPLAIELAAARVAVLSPQEMVRRLDRSLDLLTRGRRDADERQQTLRATIDWSYQLLSATEKRALARLSVFPAGFALEMADSICDAGLEALSALCDQSLLRREPAEGDEIHFRALRVIREYAFDRLTESGEADQIRRRHAAWCLDLAQQAGIGYSGDDEGYWLTRVGLSHDDFREALGWARQAHEHETMLDLGVALSVFWQAHGYLAEASGWFDEILDRADDVPPSRRVAALSEASSLAYRAGDYDRAAFFAQQQLALSREIGSERGIVYALSKLANVAVQTGEHARAGTLHEEAVEMARAASDEPGLMFALSNLANFELLNGAYGRAAELFSDALERARSGGRRDNVAIALFNIGIASVLAGAPQDALSPLEESLRLSIELGDRENIGYALVGLAGVAVEEDRQRDAALLLGAADAALEACGASLENVERGVYERTESGARMALGEEFDNAWSEGNSLSVDALVERIAAGGVRIP